MDLDHLIAVTNGANRSKGAKGPEEWRPPDEGYWCQYATDWTEVKIQWGLTMTQRETEAVIAMLDTCEDPVEVEAEPSGGYRRNGYVGTSGSKGGNGNTHSSPGAGIQQRTPPCMGRAKKR